MSVSRAGWVAFVLCLWGCASRPVPADRVDPGLKAVIIPAEPHKSSDMTFVDVAVAVPRYVTVKSERELYFGERDKARPSSGVYKTQGERDASFYEERASGPPEEIAGWQVFADRSTTAERTHTTLNCYRGLDFMMLSVNMDAGNPEAFRRAEEVVRCVLLSWRRQ